MSCDKVDETKCFYLYVTINDKSLTVILLSIYQNQESPTLYSIVYSLLDRNQEGPIR